MLDIVRTECAYYIYGIKKCTKTDVRICTFFRVISREKVLTFSRFRVMMPMQTGKRDNPNANIANRIRLRKLECWRSVHFACQSWRAAAMTKKKKSEWSVKFMFNVQMFECPTMGIQKSFYGKAQICHDDCGIDVLNSYNTPVCMVTHNGRFVRLWDGWSVTTSRHVNAFRMFHGMPKISKSEWFDLPVE